MTEEEQEAAITYFEWFEEFCANQEKHNLIDGACDPEMARVFARSMIKKYASTGRAKFYERA